MRPRSHKKSASIRRQKPVPVLRPVPPRHAFEGTPIAVTGSAACLCTGFCRGVARFAPGVRCRLEHDGEVLP